MTFLLDGKLLAAAIQKRLKSEIDSHQEFIGRPPGLAVIRVGDDLPSAVYVSNKEKACDRVGIESFGMHLHAQSTMGEILNKIKNLNSDSRVDGILLQLPLPSGLDEITLLKAIDAEKDADGIHSLNLGRLLKGEPGPRSCTPAGIMTLIKSNNVEISGKRAVVIGRSILVGQPMALMLQSANATVTVAHSKTKNLKSITKEAEILVVAAGKEKMINSEHVRNGAVIVDVGIHRSSTGGICGDVDADAVRQIASALSPVPGGVGPMTVTMLLVNTVIAWCRRYKCTHSLGDLVF